MGSCMGRYWLVQLCQGTSRAQSKAELEAYVEIQNKNKRTRGILIALGFRQLLSKLLGTSILDCKISELRHLILC